MTLQRKTTRGGPSQLFQGEAASPDLHHEELQKGLLRSCHTLQAPRILACYRKSAQARYGRFPCLIVSGRSKPTFTKTGLVLLQLVQRHHPRHLHHHLLLRGLQRNVVILRKYTECCAILAIMRRQCQKVHLAHQMARQIHPFFHTKSLRRYST